MSARPFPTIAQKLMAANAPGFRLALVHALSAAPQPAPDESRSLLRTVCSWPAIYNNLQNMDYCTTTFAHLGNREYLPPPYPPPCCVRVACTRRHKLSFGVG